jgi:hypothetical protein
LLEVFLGHKRNRITRDLELAVNELDWLAKGKPIRGGISSQPFAEA